MNGKQLIFAIGGWVLAGGFFSAAISIERDRVKTEERLQSALKIIVDDRFTDIIENFDK